MKNVLLILTIAILATSNAQNLSQVERERCNEDIKYNLEMAQKGYGEAEYLLAYRFHYTDPYDETNKAYWTSFDNKNPFVAAAYWLKKACEHNWEPAYNLYAHYCYYGRGNAHGGVVEALKWTKKALEKDSLNWKLKANEAIFMWIIDEDKFYTDENFIYPKLILDSPNMDGADSEFIEKFALICFHGLGNKKAFPTHAFVFFSKAYIVSKSQNKVNTMALDYLIYCYREGYGTDKNEETMVHAIADALKSQHFDIDWSNKDSISEATKKILDRVYSRISKDKEQMSHNKNFCDVFLLY